MSCLVLFFSLLLLITLQYVGSYFPAQGLNPDPLRWKCGVLDCWTWVPDICISFFSKYLFIFSWRTIDLQYCVDFCHTSRWISRRYTYVPSLLNFPPTSLLILPFSVVTEHWVWAPWVTQQILTVCLTYGDINVSMLLSQFIPPSPSPTVPTHVFLFCLFVW